MLIHLLDSSVSDVRSTDSVLDSQFIVFSCWSYAARQV